MNVILLSGGSGKRLWPLSNEIRSKQFLKLLHDEQGSAESMVQRVFRQMRQAGLDAQVTVATGAAQADAIRSQLGDNVHLVLEPERRNTYPAIALSCAYLFSQRKISPEETVVVLPVDPYAGLDYFRTLSAMDRAIQSGAADLVLMGIRPTYPSAKYGYMLAGSGTEPRIVRRFIEKPDEAQASSLIAQGAYWNGGVFAFKLGWLIALIREALPFTDYLDLREHYGALEKISFDYAVAEKTKSIAMVTYDGVWKDLGTWNTLAEEMDAQAIGNVITGEGTENTQIVNELGIPLLVLGAKDMIVAASPDGILVSDKHRSSYLRPYVDGLDLRPMYEERRWGSYKVLYYTRHSDGMCSLTKQLFVFAGEKISYQTHRLRDEIWTFVDGAGDLLIDGHIRNVRRGDVAYITAGMKHALRANTDLRLTEVQIGSELTEDDVVACDWDW